MGPRRKIYLALISQGLSCEEVAQKCGVSRQAVYQSVRRYGRIRKNKAKGENYSLNGVLDQVVYPHIVDYLIDHDMSVTGLARKCGISPACMLNLMRGKTELKKSQIDSLIRVTRIPYEKIFAEV